MGFLEFVCIDAAAAVQSTDCRLAVTAFRAQFMQTNESANIILIIGCAN